MQALKEIFIVLLILLNFRLLGTSRLGACVQTVALQALVIGLLPLLGPNLPTPWIMAMMAAATLVKSVVLPGLVRRALRETGVVRELEPLMGYTLSILTGTGLLVLSHLAGRKLQLPTGGVDQLLVPVTLFTMLCGLFLIIARRKAITQVLGFLVLENGIYLFGIAFAVHEPWLVQTGVLLDVLAAVFVMGITIHQINREFDHIDTDRFSTFKD